MARLMPKVKITVEDVVNGAVADDGSEYKIVFVKDGETVEEELVDAEEFYDLLSRYTWQSEMRKGGRYSVD